MVIMRMPTAKYADYENERKRREVAEGTAAARLGISGTRQKGRRRRRKGRGRGRGQPDESSESEELSEGEIEERLQANDTRLDELEKELAELSRPAPPPQFPSVPSQPYFMQPTQASKALLQLAA